MSQNREIVSVPIVVPIRMLFELKQMSESRLLEKECTDFTNYSDDDDCFISF